MSSRCGAELAAKRRGSSMEAEELTKVVEEREEEGKLTPFDRYVAMTMVIIAAVLAVITLLGHRAETEALDLQVEAATLRTDANIYHTRASDEWSYYQAKNIRSTEYQGFLGLLDALSKDPGSAQKNLQLQEEWGAEVRKYEGVELPRLKATAEQLVNQALRMEAKSAEAIRRSYQAHLRAERLDIAELAVELALVLCSIAVLTKTRPFWYAGIVVGVLGTVIVVIAATA
ncbi:MAG TPA: DUF4337 domain-containing protein [Candidatus Binataceae bacterium]|nr:DUF4337 domain-containing protein [Candidatus Binataceae bacterium]